VKFGKLKEHLGIAYDWNQDKLGNTYLEASMPKMIDEISEKFEKARGKKAKIYATPETPGKTLRKNKGAMIDLDAYRSIVGKLKDHVLCHQDYTRDLQHSTRASRTFIKPWIRSLESIGEMCWVSNRSGTKV
jgi:hypothetical protein